MSNSRWNEKRRADRYNGGGYAADAAGDETAIPGHALGYFADGELEKEADTGYTYTYDSHERRFERNWPGAEIHYFYLGDSDKVIWEDPSSTPWEDYIYLGGQRVANVMEDGTVGYYFTDHLGSTVLMTDGSGNVLAGNWPHAYTVFGADDPHYVAPTERRRYTGKERDPESGLDYFESRYYTSAMGRFLSPDEARSDSLSDAFTGQVLFSDPGPLPYADITHPQSLNKYAYAGNNPLRFFDPSGHSYLAYDASAHTISLYSHSGTFLGKWHAANNVSSENPSLRGGLKNGKYIFLDKSAPHPHSARADSSKGAFGAVGIFRLNPFRQDGVRHVGVGVHSGRSDASTRPPVGPEHPTNGCIRTTDNAMAKVAATAKRDPLEYLSVIDNSASAPASSDIQGSTSTTSAPAPVKVN